MAGGLETVEVERWNMFLNERSVLLQHPIALGRSAIHDIGVRICVLRQVDLCTRHVKEAERIGCQQARFVGVDDIVRNRGDTGCHSRIGAKRTKGSYSTHRELPIISS